ncbi:MAG: oligosaccharide flippase family protein, partial [Candidatus Nanohaloarchaea archaeon]
STGETARGAPKTKAEKEASAKSLKTPGYLPKPVSKPMKTRFASLGREYATRLLQDDLFQDSSILVVATVIGGGFNYLYQIAMGRMLGPEQYGVFGALFGLTYLIGVMSKGTGIVTTRYISKHTQQEAKKFLRDFQLRVSAFMFVAFAGLMLVSGYILDFIKFDDPVLLAIVVASALLGPVKAVNFNTLRGLQRFKAQGGLQVLQFALKLVLGVSLVALGYGLYGALGSLLITGVLTLAITVYYLRDMYSATGSYSEMSEVYRYVLPSVLAGFCLSVPANLDVIIVKNLFASSQAGLYTSATVLGKIILFLPGGIVGAMFPKVSENHSSGGTTNHLLYKALFFTGGLAASAVVFYTLFPRLIVGLMFGSEYTSIAYLVPWYGLMISVFALSQVILSYSLAKHHRRYITFFASLTAAEFATVYVLASTMLQVVQLMLAFNLVALAIGLVWYGSVEEVVDHL